MLAHAMALMLIDDGSSRGSDRPIFAITLRQPMLIFFTLALLPPVIPPHI